MRRNKNCDPSKDNVMLNENENENIDLFFRFYSLLGISLYGYEQSKKSWILSFSFILTSIWRTYFIITSSFVLYSHGQMFIEFYSQFIKSIKTQPLLKFSFVWSWRIKNLFNFVLIILFIFNGTKILKCFNSSILFKYDHHIKISKSISIRLLGYMSMFAFIVWFIYKQFHQINFLHLLLVSHMYFGYTYMAFFYDLHFLMFSLSKRTFDILIRKLSEIDDNNLTKDDSFELINDIKALGKTLYEFNRMCSMTLFCSVIDTVFSYLNNIVFFFGQTKFHGNEIFFFHFFMNILRSIFICILSWTSQNVINRFDDIYYELLDKSIETSHNYYSKYQKHSKAISLSNAFKIHELAVYRRHFKSYYFYEILPMCLGSLGHICIFIFQYMIIFIQTSLV
ncbi:hypothetical protein DERF_013501 [Dermatophagoides farinae]|uniref:Uncharacterized protein n=1 Tax=Dermatophagoides farinae TaxID=6954 RepID=A0A922HRP1_DERFA|nr:hypothetical protein DERF_013501 [Dermatophagoides farinae]